MTYLSRGAFLPICINYNSKNDEKLYVLQGHIAFLIEWSGIQLIMISIISKGNKQGN